MSEELIKINDLEIEEIFQVEGGVQYLLDTIEEQVNNVVVDISTAAGRKEVKSMAAKIAKSKTLIDKTGKTLKETYTKYTKIIDGERRTAVNFLDELKDKFRKPVTDLENAENARIAAHEEAVNKLKFFNDQLGSEGLEEQIKRLKEFFYGRDWEEFMSRATLTLETSVKTLEDLVKVRKEEEAKQAEFERLQREEQERQRIAREDQIRKEAAAKAEADKKAEIEAIERQKNQAVAKAEAERNAAIQKANKLAENKAQETKAKAADFERQKNVNRAVYNFFMAYGIDDKTAKSLVTTIALKKFKYLEINYWG